MGSCGVPWILPRPFGDGSSSGRCESGAGEDPRTIRQRMDRFDLSGFSRKKVAARHSVTPAQVALAWLLRQHGVVAIPKAANVAHVRENHAALELHLTKEDLAALDHAFPPPTEAIPLAML